MVTEIARHPHNRLLLWRVKRGMVVLLGMLHLVGAGINLWPTPVSYHKRTSACGQHWYARHLHVSGVAADSAAQPNRISVLAVGPALVGVLAVNGNAPIGWSARVLISVRG